MSDSIQRDFRTTPQFKASIKTLAHEREKTTSALIRDLLEEYANGKPQPAKKEAPPEYTRVRVVADPETWERALARAKVEDISLSEALRVLAEKALAG